ncbi:unnamed protein product, partial [marine sediment metagenome]
AFDLIRQGNSDSAVSVLFGNEYEQQKCVYSDGMANFDAVITGVAISDMKRAARTISVKAAIVIFLSPLVLLTWLIVFRSVRRWGKILIHNNRLLAEQADELVSLNKNLDQKVVERTRELEASQEFAVKARRVAEDANKSLTAEITERMEAEKSLRIFESYIKASGQGMAMSSLDGKITYANPELCRMLEEDNPEDIYGKEIADYYPEILRQRLKEEIFPDVMRLGQWKGEMMMLTKNGKIIPTYENIF